MADIKKHTDKIRKAIYGKEVRGALADGIEAINDEVEDNTEVAVNVEQRQDAIEQQFDDLQQNYTEDSPSDAEIVAARTNTKTNENYNTVGRRLDDEYEKVTAQLAETIQIGSANIGDLFEPPEQADINSYFSGGDAFAQGDVTTFNEYMNLFKTLQEDNSDYIHRYSKGFDDGGWREWVYYVYEPKKYTKTIILSAGVQDRKSTRLNSSHV